MTLNKYRERTQVILQWFSAAIKPDPVLTVSEWADKIGFSQESSERGRTVEDGPHPILQDVMDCLSVFIPLKSCV